MGSKNKVIAGEYEGKSILHQSGATWIMIDWHTVIILDKSTIESYELIDETKIKSASSAIGRGIIGGVILGPIGLLAAVSAKTKGVYILAIHFKDGNKSLIEIDDKIYKIIISKCF